MFADGEIRETRRSSHAREAIKLLQRREASDKTVKLRRVQAAAGRPTRSLRPPRRRTSTASRTGNINYSIDFCLPATARV